MRVVLPALLLLAISCGPEREDSIYMQASAFGDDDAPLANTLLLLERSKTYGWDDLEPFAELTTDASGAFSHEFEHRDLSNDEGSRTSFRVRRPTQQGARAVLDFDYYGRADFRLPHFRDVQVETQLDASTLSFMRPAIDEVEKRLDLFELHAGQQLAWREVAVTETLTFEPFHVEDFAQIRAQVRGTAFAELIFKSPRLDLGSKVSYTRSVFSQWHELSIEPFIPLSRGASCSFPLKAEGPCPLTDGKLDKVDVADLRRVGPQEIRIDLDEPRVVQKLVLRGVDTFHGTLVAQTSSNGTQWKDAARFDLSKLEKEASGLDRARLPEAFTLIPLHNAEAVRHVRLVPEYGLLPAFVREISLFE